MKKSLKHIRPVVLLLLTAGLLAYLFWPRDLLGPPEVVAQYIDDRYAPEGGGAPADTLLLAGWKAYQEKRITLGDSLFEAMPDSVPAWIDARLFMAIQALKDDTPGKAIQALEVPLPDSTWEWPPARYWYLGLARAQAGFLPEAYRAWDSLSDTKDLNSLRRRLHVWLPDSMKNKITP